MSLSTEDAKVGVSPGENQGFPSLSLYAQAEQQLDEGLQRYLLLREGTVCSDDDNGLGYLQ